MKFPDHPAYRNAMGPFRMECDLEDLEVDGDIPAALQGAFYRCGPDRRYPPIADDVWPAVNGDGVVSMFRIGGGHVDFRMRYVRTDRYMAERKARRALFGAYRNPFTDDPSVEGVDRTLANTSVVWYDRRLLALKEDGLPHEIDPFTLETVGKFDFGGAMASPTFTAHPKFDPDTGEMTFYAYEVGGLASPLMALGVGSADGRLLKEEVFEPPYGCWIHDFAVTEKHVVFPILPATADIARMKAGGPHWMWDPTLPSWLGVMPRDGSVKDMRYFRGPPRWSFHTMNAFDDGDRVVFDTTVAIDNAYFPGPAGRPSPQDGAFHLTRLVCDLSRNDDVFTEERLLELPSDFYGCDPRWSGKPYRHGYMAGRAGDGPGYDSILHFDHQTRESRAWRPGPAAMVQEPVFVPRAADAAEGHGYLLSVVNRFAERRSELVVLDLQDLERGPLAVIHMPVILPMAVHGDFVPESALAQARRRPPQPPETGNLQ